MDTLNERIRQLNQVVQQSADLAEDFRPLAAVVGKRLNANAYLVNPQGQIIGYGLEYGADCAKFDPDKPAALSAECLQKVASARQAATVMPVESCIFHKSGCKTEVQKMLVAPIHAGSDRLGSLVLTRKKNEFGEDDLTLAEVCALILGAVLIRCSAERSAAYERHKTNVQVALDSLSFSEMQAIFNVFKELKGTEGFLVASKIADRIGITRSVIVNAMRKLESAGVVESRSLGMKGTYIRIQNEFFLDELTKRTHGR